MFQRNLCLLLAFLVALGPRASFASEDPIEELKKKLAAMETHYRPYLDGTYQAMLATYYSIRSQDHLRSLHEIERKSQEGANRLSNYLGSFETSYAAIEAQGAQVDASAVELFANMAMVQREARRARIIEADADILSKSWSEACEDSKIAKTTEFFYPNRLFTPENIAFFTPTPDNAGFGVTYSYSGDGHDVRPMTDNMGMSQEEYAGMVSVQAIGAYFPPYGPIIAVAVCLCYALFKFAMAQWKQAEEEKEQWKLIKQIRDYQEGQIADKSNSAGTVVRAECAKSFPANIADRMRTPSASQYRERAESTRDRMQSSVEQDLKPKLLDYFRYLEEDYLPKLEARFASEMRQSAVDAIYGEKNIDNFVIRAIEPVGERILKQAEAYDRLSNQQSLWTELIRGDARYRKGDGFSFDGSAAPTNIPAFSNGWTQWSKILREGLLK